MVDQGKSLLRITPTRWGTVSTGGFPPEVRSRRAETVRPFRAGCHDEGHADHRP